MSLSPGFWWLQEFLASLDVEMIIVISACLHMLLPLSSVSQISLSFLLLKQPLLDS